MTDQDRREVIRRYVTGADCAPRPMEARAITIGIYVRSPTDCPVGTGPRDAEGLAEVTGDDLAEAKRQEEAGIRFVHASVTSRADGLCASYQTERGANTGLLVEEAVAQLAKLVGRLPWGTGNGGAK